MTLGVNFNMNIQRVSGYNKFNNVQNSRKNNSEPSFQHLRIISKEYWDKDILAAVTKNKEIKNFENYLEKKHSVLELTTSFDSFSKDGKSYSITGTFARKFKIMGIDGVISPMASKEQTLSNLKHFKCDKLIKIFEKEEAKYNQQHPQTQMRDVMFKVRDEQKSLIDSILDFFF